jgi:hypothetical protein
MSEWVIGVNWLDRRSGKVGRTLRRKGGAPHVAIRAAVNQVWFDCNRKQRNDIRRDGLTITCRLVAPLQEAPAEVYKMLDRAIAGRPM